MQQTPSDKGQLSSCLKERLKRCGRYHASPPVAKQPKNTDKWQRRCPEFKRYNQSKSSTEYIAKRLCKETSKNEETPVKSEICSEGVSMISPGSLSHTQNNDDIHLDQNTGTEPVFKDLLLNGTHFQRRKSDSFRIMGSKLSFECQNGVSVKCDADFNLSNSYEHIVDTHNLVADNHCNLDGIMSTSKMIRELTLKEEELRKLRMVKMYRSKNNLSELQVLIDKWRNVSQQAVQDLHEAMSEPKPSLTQLINHLGIDHKLIQFSTENDEEVFFMK